MDAFLRRLAVFYMMLLFCFLQLISIRPALCASSIQLGPGTGDSGEDEAEAKITRLIGSYSAVAGYSVYPWYGYSGTNRTSIYDAADGVGTAESIVFYVGDGCVDWWCLGFDDHYEIMTSDGLVSDVDIFPHSEDQNLRFSYIFACHQGDKIGGNHLFSGAYDMPYAWLHTASLSEDGYADPDEGGRVFLGYLNLAPWLTNDEDWQVNDGAYKFLYAFYTCALGLGLDHTVNDALDIAAYQVWGVPNYGESILYNGYNYSYWDYDPPHMVYETGYMKVYGDGSIHLSETTLLAAMKTKTNGYFYLPNLAHFLKIEQFFSNSNVTGDQTGGTSPLGPISNWPDNTVNMFDQYFVGMHHGAAEGQPNWNYMADVDPNRVINMLDMYTVAMSFGQSGNYTMNLTGVQVIFSNGAAVPPDTCGFVAIPLGVINYTVYRNGSTIGALVTYWDNP